MHTLNLHTKRNPLSLALYDVQAAAITPFWYNFLLFRSFLNFVKLLALYLYGILSLPEFLLVVEDIFPMHVP